MNRRRTRSRVGRGRNSLRLQRRVIFVLFIVVSFFVFHYHNQQQYDIIPLSENEIRVHFIDVGQGDAILVQSIDHAVLIDAGPTAAGANVVAHIAHFGVDTLDYVVATHPHADHIGGLPAVLDRFEVRELWAPDVVHTTNTFERFLDAVERNGLEITPISAGATLSAGIIQMLAVAPNSSGHSNLNDYSIVLHMRHGETSFLFTGDAETFSENEMLAADWDLQSNVLNVGHHGSRTSSTDRFLDAVQPEAAVIQLAADNRYGHPHREVLDRFDERDILVLRTDELGSIIMTTDGVEIFIYG